MNNTMRATNVTNVNKRDIANVTFLMLSDWLKGALWVVHSPSLSCGAGKKVESPLCLLCCVVSQIPLQ